MKRIITTVIFCFVGIAISAQDMSHYIEEFKRTDANFDYRLAILESVSSAGISGIGEFYHEALKYFLVRTPDIRTIEERNAAEKSAIILCNGLGNEKYTAACPELWNTVVFYDVLKNENDGIAMQNALIALGKVDAKDYLPHIIQRLEIFNSQTFTDEETRRFSERGVIGCVNALEALHDPLGYRPVFFVYVGSYDFSVINIAGNALYNIVDDPTDVIIEIISDPLIGPALKLEAWKEILKTNVPGSSKAKVASVAIATSHTYNTSTRVLQMNLREMRNSAIDTVRDFGVSDASVYEYLEKTYSNAFNTGSPDYEDIVKVLNALSSVKTEEAVELLYKFLQELHSRRRAGPWAYREKTVFEWVISSIEKTGTNNANVRLLLSTIQRTNDYTAYEQRITANALNALGN